MKTRSPNAVKYPLLYREFKTAEEIGNLINRSKSYVIKALHSEFTEREQKILCNFTGMNLFEQEN